MGEADLEVEWEVGARYESLSYFSGLTNTVMTCFHSVKVIGFQLLGSMSFYNQVIVHQV